MSTLALDIYAMITKLKDVGVPEQQAVVQVETLTKAIDTALEQSRHEHELDNLVTNKALDARIRETELKFEIRIKETESKLELKISETKADLIRWVVGVGMLQITIITALMLKLTGTH